MYDFSTLYSERSTKSELRFWITFLLCRKIIASRWVLAELALKPSLLIIWKEAKSDMQFEIISLSQNKGKELYKSLCRRRSNQRSTTFKGHHKSNMIKQRSWPFWFGSPWILFVDLFMRSAKEGGWLVQMRNKSYTTLQ